MLSINGLTIMYEDKEIVSNFNIKIEKGEIVSIVGESGSGKSSIVRAILKLLPTSAKIVNADIRYKGQSLIDISTEELNKIRGNNIALLFQDSGLAINPIRKIGNQFIQYIRVHKQISKKEAEKLAMEQLEKMNLDAKHVMKTYIYNLSGGMKQRVGLAFAMSLDPEVILLDEPTSALDKETQSLVIKELIRIKENKAILMITHNIGLALEVSDRIIILKEGEQMDKESDYAKQLLRGGIL